MRIVTFPGVLRPPSDCLLLARTMHERGLARDRRVLDLFTGTGALAVAAALDGAGETTAIDIARRAIWNAKLNALRNGVRVRALRGDLFAPVAGERFDLILANPPYIPSASDELPRRGAARAWDAGTDGRLLLDRLCDEAPAHLSPAGVLLLVHSSLAGERPTLDRLAAGGLEVRVVARERGPLGPIVAARSAMLERRGLLAPGEREEDVLVVEGVRLSS